MERHVRPVVQPLDLIAHVLEKYSILLEVDLQAAGQQAQQELDATAWDHSLAIRVHNVPDDLEMADIIVTRKDKDTRKFIAKK